jgi:GxxExxY protein
MMAIEEHEELTWRILKCAFHVQNTLGCGFLEKVYENAMMIALRKEGLQAEQQVPMQVYYEGLIVGEYVADIVVERTVIVEIKATEDTPAFFKAQVLNYLKATSLSTGLLLNFGKPKLDYRRLALRTDRKQTGGSESASG